MGVLIKRHEGNFALTGIAKLSSVGFIGAFAMSFVITVWALYLDSFLHDIPKVGMLSAFLTLIGIVSFFITIPYVEKNSKSKIFSYALFGAAIIYFSLYFVTSLYVMIALSIMLTISGTLRLTSFGLIIRDKSKKSKLTRNEGIMYTFTNSSYIIGPLIAGFIANKYGLRIVFIFASLLFLTALLIFKIDKIKDNRKEKIVHKDIIKNSIEFFKDKKRVISYIIGGGVSFWWILIYLYMPLYIIKNGLSGLWVGYFLFAIPIPLILLEYKFANTAGKTGFKTFFKLGFLIPAIAALVAFFFVENIFIVLGLLIFASIGLAMLEPTAEAYFFKITNKEEEERFYGPYNTRLEVVGLFGKFIPAVLLLFIQFKYIFLLFSFVMFVLFLISHSVKE